jgi:hypothetical protein
METKAETRDFYQSAKHLTHCSEFGGDRTNVLQTFVQFSISTTHHSSADRGHLSSPARGARLDFD